MVEELGLDEARAQLLNTFGSWRVMRGDTGGFDALKESIALLEHSNSAEAQRPYNNLADGFYSLGEFDKAAEAAEQMRQAWKRFAGLDWLRWTESQEIRLHYLAGRWDDVLEMADRWIADAQAGPGHYLEGFWRWHRSRIQLARGDRDGAAEEGARSLAAARVAADAQILLPALAIHSRLLWSLGDAAAQRTAQELVELCRRYSLHIAHDWFTDVAIVLAGLGLSSELEIVADSVPTPTPWREAGLALGRGDAPTAVEIFGEMGARPFEAEARLIAAGEGIDADLRAAIAFFKDVGAVGYLAEAERLLARSRSA
jgi:hypothetical protein